jgi:endonuclease YncB( thermonuclease family)
LKNGFAKLNTPKNTDFDADYFKTLKEAQLIAQSKLARIWKDFKPAEEKKQQKPSTSDFMGRVIEVHSGDSLSVERDGDFKQFRIYLATVKAPILQKKPGEEPDPWAWDSKEALRKAVIGKKVRVIMEFSRTVKLQGEQGGEKNMDFATVFLDKNEKNVSCQLLEKGLLRTNVSKSGDNASKYIEDLLAAEKKAVEGKIGVYSASPAPIRVFNDLVANTKKSKDFEAMIMKRPNRKINGVIEYCFSGMRFKVRLDGENTAIALNLLGVKTMANDKNQPKLLELSNDALQFAKDTLFQRDVTVDLEFADKRGSFFGTVSLKNTKEDFGLMLV